MYVIVVGGGKIGYFLTKRLVTEDHEVLLLEKDRRRYSALAEELGDVVAQGDGCEVRMMAEAGFSRADVVVAVTGDDEDNLVICQMAKKKFQAPRTVARVNDPANLEVFRKLGIDTTVSSTQIIFNLLEQQIEQGEIVPIGALKNGNIEIVMIAVSGKSPVLGSLIKSVVLPGNAMIISVVRNDNAILPQADTRFEDGDSVIAIVDSDEESDLRSIFSESH